MFLSLFLLLSVSPSCTVVTPATFLWPLTLKFVLCAPTNGFLNLQKSVNPVPFIAITWGNYNMERVCRGFAMASATPLCLCPASPCLIWPTFSSPSPESLYTLQVSQNGQTAQVWWARPLHRASWYSCFWLIPSPWVWTGPVTCF